MNLTKLSFDLHEAGAENWSRSGGKRGRSIQASFQSAPMLTPRDVWRGRRLVALGDARSAMPMRFTRSGPGARTQFV
jgi:hypothetical protein